MSRLLAFVGAVLGALIVTMAVPAANPTKEKIARTAAGNALAMTEIVQKADFGAGWSGGAKKPSLSSNMHCPSYKPKQSDLVVVGAAESTWQKQISTVDSEAEVLRTPKMVQLDWQRTVTAPQVTPCLRQSLAKAAGKGGKLVSFRVVAFPHLATYTRAYRVVSEVSTPAGKVRLEFEILAFGSGRSELSLFISGLAADKASLRSLELQLAHRLASRLHH